MRNRWLQVAAGIALGLAVAACQSEAERAAAAMAQAQQLAAAGQYGPAQAQFDIAVAARDDLPELWMMRARNQIALNDYAGAYVSYRSVLDQDRTNREALDAMAQLSLASNRIDDAKDYAGQLLALSPEDPTGLIVAATVAFRTGRYDSAQEGVDTLLKQSPGNERALVLASRLEQRRGRINQAIALIQPIFQASGGSDELRVQLTDLYARQAFGSGLLAITRRDAGDRPRDPKVLTFYAGQLLIAGQPGPAIAALDTAHTVAPGDAQRIATARMLANTDVAPAVLASALGAATAPQADLVLAVAEYALARGDYAAADALLAGRQGPVDAASADIEGAHALAAAALGRIAEARTRAAATLAIDGGQPWALMARTLVDMAGRDPDAALRDIRQVVSDNRQFAPGYALLARVLAARGDRLLADKALFDAGNADRDDPVALRQLAALLVARDRTDDAIIYARRFTLRNPGSVFGWTLRQQLCRRTRDAGCVARSGAILARLRGGIGPMPPAPADEQVGERDYRDDDSGDGQGS